KSVPWPIGARRAWRSTWRGTRFRCIPCTRGATRASVARPVRAPWSPAKASARGAGGGKRTPRRNVEFTSPPMARWRETVAEAETNEHAQGLHIVVHGHERRG